MNLPNRWRFRHGAYFYRVPQAQRHLWDGKTEFRLGQTEAEAWRTWFERGGDNEDVLTMNDLFTEYWREYVLIHLAVSTRDSYKYHIQRLRESFGLMRPTAVRLVHAHQFRAKRHNEGATIAGNREVSVLSSVLSYAASKGMVESNPLKGQIERKGIYSEKVRKRVPTLRELETFCDINPHLRGYVTLKRITGLRQGQLLAINLTEHWDGDGLRPPTSKGGRDTRYKGPALRTAVKSILGKRLPVAHLFLNTRQKAMTTSGFKSLWRRAMTRFVEAGGERFNEHDIRKYVASEAATLDHAQRLLGHQDARTTARVYRVGKPEDVEVLT